MSPVSALFDGVRAHGAMLLAASSEPAAELMALVWGPRFDREHARTLLTRTPALQPDMVRSVMRAADSFDRLPLARQQRIRGLIARRTLSPLAKHNKAPATMPA